MIYIFIALVFYSIAILFGTAASRNANTNLAAAVTNLMSAILPIVIAFPLLNKKTFVSQKFGLIMALCSGLSIAIFALALNKSFSLNKVGIVSPLVFGGAIFLTTFLSYFIFKEKIVPLQAFGLLFLAVGFGLIIYSQANVR